jgi:hypothetical protein
MNESLTTSVSPGKLARPVGMARVAWGWAPAGAAHIPIPARQNQSVRLPRSNLRFMFSSLMDDRENQKCGKMFGE